MGLGKIRAAQMTKSLLRPEETLIAGATFMPRGAMARTGVVDGVGGYFLGDIAGRVISAPIEAVLDRATEPKMERIAHTKLAKNLVIAVTNQRFLAFGGNRRPALADLPFDDITSVKRLIHQVSFFWIPVFRVEITFSDGAMWPLETSPFLWREASTCISALEAATRRGTMNHVGRPEETSNQPSSEPQETTLELMKNLTEEQLERAAAKWRGAPVRLADSYAKVRVDFSDACKRAAAPWKRLASRIFTRHRAPGSRADTARTFSERSMTADAS
jgi:hypothetical protein